MRNAPIVRKWGGNRRFPAGKVYIAGGVGYLDGVYCPFAVAVKTGPNAADYEVAAYVFSEAHAQLFAKALAAAKQEGA